VTKRKKSSKNLKPPSQPITPQKQSKWIRLGKIVGGLKRAATINIITKKPISRRRLLQGSAGMITGATLTGAATYKAHMARIRHEITVGLIRHQGSIDIPHLERVIDTARAIKTPFHAIGLEMTDVGPREFQERAELLKSTLTSARNKLQQLQSQGRTRKQALDEMFHGAHEKSVGGFIEAVVRLALERNLPLVPIEWYSKNEHKQFDTLDRLHIELASTMVTRETLEHQLEMIDDVVRSGVADMSVRNQRVRESMPRAINTLKTVHPHLKKYPELRVLYIMGRDHIEVALGNAPPGFTVGLSRSHSPEIGIIPKPISMKLLHPNKKPLTRVEKQRAVIASNLYTPAGKLLDAGKIRELETLRQTIGSLTSAEFAILNKRTAQKPMDERVRIIMEFLKKKK
jgi:hypothetical protein